MYMEQNARKSFTGNSKHIDIRYFFIADQVKKKEVNIQCCPIKIMLEDFFVKPLQEALFRKFREVIVGYKSITTLSIPH